MSLFLGTTQIHGVATGDAAVSGTELPELTNPADASKIISGYEAIDENGEIIIGSINVKDGNDVIASGATVTTPAGYYADAVSKSVATTTQVTPSVSIDHSTGLVTATATQTEGYIYAGTKTATMQLAPFGGRTITPTTYEQSIPSSAFTTGTIIIAGDADLVAENIVEGKNIFNVIGTAVLASSLPKAEEVAF